MDEICALEWDITPKEDYEYDWVADQIKEVKEFMKYPNKKQEPFSKVLGKILKDILEIDAGVIVKTFDINSFDTKNIEPKSGAPMLKPIGQRHMTEFDAYDGASFLKENDKFGFEKGFWQYSYQIPAHPMWFNKEEIVYIMEHPRSMSCYGYARTQSILDIVKSLHYSTLYNKRFFEESPIPDGALSLLDTNEVEMKAFMSYWNNEFKAQPHKVAVTNKDLKWQPFAVTNRELEFLDTQKWYFNIVISAFGLTPTELGITEDSNRATSATQAELVKRKGIRPFLNLIENYINIGIIPEFGYEGIEFQFIYDDPAEKKARLDNWNLELSMGVKTINEVRDELGLEPLPNGDVSNSFMDRMTQGGNQNEPMAANPKGDGETKEEQTQGQGYKETVNREEANNGPTKKSAPEEPDPEQLKMGIEVEREHQQSLKLTDAEIEQIARDHLKEDPEYYTKLMAMESKKEAEPTMGKPGMGHSDKWWEIYHALRREGYSKERAAKIANSKMDKGIDDGQYYRDQPISQPLRPSGAHFQPQNKPQDTSLPSPWQQHLSEPPTLKNLVNCPLCGQPTLASLNSVEQLEDDLRCTSCGARFRSSELLAAPMMEEMANVLQQYNISNPVRKTKDTDFTKELDINLNVKDFCGFDCSKSFPFASSFADTPKYRSLLKRFLKDLSKEKVDNIIDVLVNSLKGFESLSQVADRINEVIKDPQRAELIARTEVIRLANEGNLQRMKEKDQKLVKYISAPEDGRLCEKCKKKDGQIYTLKNASGVIPTHPRCRCCWSEYEELY